MTTAMRPIRRDAAALLLSPVLVALTTWALASIQSALIAQSDGHYVRPFGIGYVVSIALITAVGGLRSGLLTLALSLLSAAWFLEPGGLASTLRNPLDAVELLFLGLVGGLMVAGGEAMRRNAQLLEEKKKAAELERVASEQQRRFLRDVLSSVTDHRLNLCDHRSELPPCLLPIGEPVSLTEDDVRALRERVCETMLEIGFPDERCHDLMTAASEAAMNAVVHGRGGEGRVCVGPENTVQVWIEDRGKGIDLDQLPRATLERGHSTVGTLGHGFWLMLQTADRLWLLTGETGTVVVLEQERVPPAWAWA